MLAIKLKIVGRKNQRTFRVIVQEAKAKLDGKNVEDLGWYNPHTNQFKVNKDRIDYWVKNGAQPTDSVEKLLKKVQTSEITTYETREGRKKNKGPKAEAGAETPVAEGEPQAEEAVAEASAPEGEDTPAEEKKEETPAEEPKEEEKPADEPSAPESESEAEPVEEKKEDE